MCAAKTVKQRSRRPAGVKQRKGKTGREAKVKAAGKKGALQCARDRCRSFSDHCNQLPGRAPQLDRSACLLLFLHVLDPGRSDGRGAEQIALQAVDAIFHQELCVLLVFNRFRDCQHVKLLGNAD